MGWWVIKTSEGEYGKDFDVPDVESDQDADDYDEDLAENGRPLIRERVPGRALSYADVVYPRKSYRVLGTGACASN